MAPRRRLDEDEEDVDRTEEYYRNEREMYNNSMVSKRNYGDSCKYLQKMINENWKK